MITNVKMIVTPELSERVQEIVFANGGEWNSSGTKVKNTETKYLYINANKSLEFGSDDNNFNKGKEKEISTYAFVATNGMESWLPKYDEIALFECSDKIIEAKFIKYDIKSEYPFITTAGAFQKCLKISDTKTSFMDFHQDNTILHQYMKNIQVANQRWSSIDSYMHPSKICKLEPKLWITDAFNWCKAPEDDSFWGNINTKWLKYLGENPNINWTK